MKYYLCPVTKTLATMSVNLMLEAPKNGALAEMQALKMAKTIHYQLSVQKN